MSDKLKKKINLFTIILRNRVDKEIKFYYFLDKGIFHKENASKCIYLLIRLLIRC